MRSLEVNRLENSVMYSILRLESRGGRPPGQGLTEKNQLCVEISIKNLEDLDFTISDGE